jgi:hypothetical protein
MSFTRRALIAGTAAAMSAHLVSQRFGESDMMEEDVLELRQYTLYGGKRDKLIQIFEKNFIEPQNALGAHVLGTFLDLDEPDRFVWFRGFRDMPARQKALETFYGGPVWQAHKNDANATMVDSDNVLLLRPASPGHGISEPAVSGAPGAVYGVTTYYLGDVNAAHFAEFFDHALIPLLTAAGVHPIARLASEEQANNFPRLPVREHDRTFLWLARWASLKDYDAFLAHSSAWSGWRDAAPPSVLPALMQKPERLRLIPTARSKMQ